MSITSSFTLAIVTTDGSASLTKPVTGLSFPGIQQDYISPLTIGVAPPPQPTCTPGAGGSMTAGNYLVKITYTNAPQGESLPSTESTSQTVSASGKLTVASPPASGSATGYNVYITAAGGSTNTETKQNTNPIPIGTPYVQSAAVTSGSALPGSNTTLSYTAVISQSPVQLGYVRNLANQLSAPSSAPALNQVSAGALTATTYYVQVTYVNALGESLPSAEASKAVSANSVLTVSSPPSVAGATGYNVYVSNTAGGGSGAETKQNSTPIAIGTQWQEPTSGLIGGSALPTANSTIRTAAVTWTAQGGTSNKVIDLVAQAAVMFCEPSAGNSIGGITALTVAASDILTPIETFLAG